MVEDLLRFFIAFARENPKLYRKAWVMPEVGGESPAENRQGMQATVSQLANILQKGMNTGVFTARQPFLVAGTVPAMVNTPYILFHCGKLTDPDLRDRMVEEVLVAASNPVGTTICSPQIDTVITPARTKSDVRV